MKNKTSKQTGLANKMREMSTASSNVKHQNENATYDTEPEYDHILKKIHAAAHKGKNKIKYERPGKYNGHGQKYSGIYSFNVLCRLVMEGFQVSQIFWLPCRTYTNQSSEAFYIISWGKE